MKNLHYQSENIANFYEAHRQRWADFYPSEHKVIERLRPQRDSRVIDMGCGCGGLGNALRERFGITDYTGVDINRASIQRAQELHPWAKFLAGDFLEVAHDVEGNADLAFSLSCADWNVETEALLGTLFAKLRPHGHLIFSCRLTNDAQVKGLREARQSVDFPGAAAPVNEFAPYKVYRLPAILDLLGGIGPVERIYGYGYWGKVPGNVRDLPYEEVFYAVFSVEKAESNAPSPARLELDISIDMLSERPNPRRKPEVR